MKAGKILVVALGVIIIVLLAVLFFYNPAKAPPTPRVPANSVSTSTAPQ